MSREIRIAARDRVYTIPNKWDALTPAQWRNLVGNYMLVEQGRLSVGELRIRLLCDLMGWRWRKVSDEDQISTLIVLSEQLTFPFKIAYPDNNAALATLSDDDYAKAVRTEPEHLDIPAAERLRTLPWRYLLDLCFFHQMTPTVDVGGMTMFGYKAAGHHGAISTSLTALQYIEATEAMEQKNLPWLASILYNPEPYDSNQAHAMADDFAHLDPLTLQAVYLNFSALCNFLFTKTPFTLLTKFKPSSRVRAITTSMHDALYDLSKEGLGNAREVENLNVLTYLRILRKRTIDSVRQLHGMKMELDKIAQEVGLPLEIITKII